MTIGFIGLGKMGMNMVTRLIRGGHSVVAYARTKETVDKAVAVGAVGATSLADLVSKLPGRKIIWVMVTAGEATTSVLNELAALIGKDDILIDGGNSNYHDTKARGAMLAVKGIRYIDSGTSGGIWGLANGYCMMLGGDKSAFDEITPILTTLAPTDGFKYFGNHGAGHYVKMIHNGIEYGMMQAYAEGFEILKASEYSPNLAEVSHLWNQGSVVRSWLLELAVLAFKEDPALDKIKGYVADSGEGRWTVIEAIDRDVPALTLTYALMHRFQSRQEDSFAAKVLAALRNQFGGHAVKERRS